MFERERIQALRRQLRAKKLHGAYLTSPIVRRYFTGFRGTTGSVFVTQGKVKLFTDFRYTERAEEETPDIVDVEDWHGHIGRIAEVVPRHARVGFEDHEMNVAFHALLTKKLKRIRLLPISSTLEELRAIKDDAELASLKSAITATDTAFQLTLRWLKKETRAKKLPTEQAVAQKFFDFVHSKKLGELAFETIVASGPNAARPHHEPTSRRIRVGDPVLMDLGVAVNGYHADMTRTVFIGTPSAKLLDMYTTTLKAQNAAYLYIKKGGRSAHQADAAARTLIDKKFPNSFGHALGHGVGLEIHELPTLSPKSPHRLKPGMVFSIEPGSYLTGEGGIRIEDLVLLKKEGVEYLSKSPKSLKSMIL